jgi:23S rRNA (guanosine2251-2'-O)-methyltransferase
MSVDLKDDLVFGRNAVLAFLSADNDAQASHSVSQGEAGQVSKVLLADGMRPDRRIDEIKRLAKLKGVPVAVVERRRLDRLVGPEDRHQGVVAQVSKVPIQTLEEYLPKLLGGLKSVTELDPDNLPVLAILDGIEDPQNLGAIIRVAECAGVRAILLPARRSAPITGTVARTSAGAVANLPVIRIGNIVNAIEQLKRAGFWVAGLDVSAKQNYFDCDLSGPLVIVVGSEGRGISRLVAEHCDFLLHIPMFGKTNSLNASVSFAVIVYELLRQRLKKGER